MIHFYNPLYLIALPLVFLPVVFHLLHKRNVKKIPFTYVWIIQKIIKERAQRKRIIEIIVLLLRCLIIFLLIIFLAKPIGYRNPKNNLNMLIIALDNSFSTRTKISNGSKLQLFKDTVLRVLQRLKDNSSKIQIVSFNEEVSLISESSNVLDDFSKIKNSVIGIKETYKNTNFLALLNYIKNILEKNEDKNNLIKVIVFSDLAEHFIKDNYTELIKNVNLNKISSTDWFFAYPNYEENNYYINELNMIDQESDSIVLEYKPNSTLKTNKKIYASLFLIDKQTDFTFLSSFNKSHRFRFTYKNDVSDIFGYINLQNDSLHEDNNFYFCHNLTNKPEVLFFINEPFYLKGLESSRFFIEKISNLGWNIEVKNYDLIKKDIDLSDYNKKNNNLIFFNFSSLDILEKNMDKLKDSNIIIIPAEEIDFDSFDRNLSGIEFIETNSDPINGFKVTVGNKNEFEGFVKEFEYDKLFVNRKFRVTITNKKIPWNILLSFKDNTPALLNKDNLYIFTFPFTTKYTNIIYKPFFIGFLSYILEKDSKNNSNKTYYFISESVAINGVVDIYDNSKSNEKLKEEYFYKTNEEVRIFYPGIFNLRTSNGKIEKVAINISPFESNNRIIDREKIKKLMMQLSAKQVFFLDLLETDSIGKILNWYYGQEYTSFVIYAIIIFFIFETILSRFKKSKL